MVGLACAIGLILGLYFLGAGLFDLCYGVGSFRPQACASGPLLGAEDFSLIVIGISLALASVTVLASAVRSKGNLESGVRVVWFVRSVFAVGICCGILVFYGSLSGICDPFGPFGTTGTFCPSFNAYEVMGPLLALVSLVGLAWSFLTQRTTHIAGSSDKVTVV